MTSSPSPSPPGQPLHPAVVKAGETLLAQALESRREICKSLITTTTASLGGYVALLGFVVQKDRIAQFVDSSAWLAVTPVILFVVAASMYVCGYFHADSAAASNVLDWLKNNDEKAVEDGVSNTLRQRQRFLWVGNVAYWVAVVTALAAIYYGAKT